MNNVRLKILILAIGLVVVTQVGDLATILYTAKRDVSAQAQTSLQKGGTMIREVMRLHTDRFVKDADLLAADIGFRQAVAAQDARTITASLAKYSRLADADIAILLGPDGRVLASTLYDRLMQAAYPEITDRADASGFKQSTIDADGSTYSLITVPLTAPGRGVWVSMGFAIDNDFADELSELTGLEVTLLSTRQGRNTVLGTSMHETAPRDIAAAFAADTRPAVTPQNREVGGADYLVLSQPLGGQDSDIVAVLHESLVEAMTPYRTMRDATIMLGGAALGVAILGAFIVAGAITRPVRQLAGAVHRIANGDYSRAVEINTHDELEELAVAFNAMQIGIAEREKRMMAQALYDPLTGLPNRARARELLGEAITRAGKRNQPVSLLLIDLNCLGNVGSSLGHEFGDALVQQTAARLRTNLDASHILARLGGDEFLVVMENIDTDGARETATRLIGLLEAGFSMRDATISLDVFVGICVVPDHGCDADELLQRAAVAKHDARGAEENLRFYEDGTEQRHMRQLAVLGDLRRAVRDDELALYVQPKIDLKTRKICGAEALVRWDHPTMGFLPPGEFIPIAEQSGNISLITHWIIATAIRQCRLWHEEGLDLPISINLSGHDLQNKDLSGFIMETLHDNGLDPGHLVLEITEAVLVHDFGRASRVLEYLRGMGARISMDDFGTGYSSLAQIKLLPVDELKIDRSFVTNLPDNPQDLAIVSSTIKLAHNLGLELVAEGVETRVAMDWLAEQGCDRAQGFLISRPMPAELFSQWAGHFDGEVSTQVVAFASRKAPA